MSVVEIRLCKLIMISYS